MDSPYRSAPHREQVEAPRDRGIVGDVVAQFADPLAFYRELVQNAIDAGTAAVEVELRHDAAAGALRATVRDRGEGMDRALIEDSLLVLFRSTKDRDPTKIGKFGIGFASVLAPGPRLVVVDTVRAGRRLILHLHPDLSYELFEGGPATRTGTAVELELPAAPDVDVADVARRSEAALRRWCRHAAVPIHLVARDAAGATVRDVRIDAPLGLDDAVVEVRGVSGDGATTVVVGVRRGGAAYAGFFNRGLMLHETTTPLADDLAGVAFKALDARLGHTLSRDDVRRDAAFDDVLALVRDLATTRLPAAAATALAAAAADADADADADGERWRALFEALDAADLPLAAEHWVVPLAAPLGATTAIAAVDLPRRRPWAARGGTPLCRALAAAGSPVVALAAPGLAARVARSCGRTLVDVDTALTLVTAVPATGADLALADALGRLLERAHRAPPAVRFAELDGALATAPWVAGDRDDAVVVVHADAWVLAGDVGTASPFGRLRRRALVLNVADPLIAAARRRAVIAPVEAAALVARTLLRHHDALDADGSLALFAATLDHLDLRGAS